MGLPIVYMMMAPYHSTSVTGLALMNNGQVMSAVIVYPTAR